VDVTLATHARRVAEERLETLFTASTMFFFAVAFVSERRERLRRLRRQHHLPAHVRKSFAVKCGAWISLEYSLTSSLDSDNS
jgi:hypothetical protein